MIRYIISILTASALRAAVRYEYQRNPYRFSDHARFIAWADRDVIYRVLYAAYDALEALSDAMHIAPPMKDDPELEAMLWAIATHV